MPQPLSRVAPNAEVMLGNAGDRPIERHPRLAAVALEAIASWSNVEAFLLRLFLQLFGGNQSLASSVYLSLEGQSAKTAAIRAAAKEALSGRADELAVLDAILAIAKTNEKDRNKLAHGSWGDSSELTDALLVFDPRVDVDQLDYKFVYVYREADFRAIVAANDQLCKLCQGLRFVLQVHETSRDGRLLRQLLAAPEVAERIARQAQRAAQQ